MESLRFQFIDKIDGRDGRVRGGHFGCNHGDKYDNLLLCRTYRGNSLFWKMFDPLEKAKRPLEGGLCTALGRKVEL
jgi:hypothetical protein